MDDDPATGSDEVTDEGRNRRSSERRAVLKGAKLLFDDGVIDCLVLNLSKTGVRVRTAVTVAVPEQVRVRFSDGATYPARRRWVAGLEAGFLFVGQATLPDEAAKLAGELYQTVRAIDLETTLQGLRALRFFGDVGLQAAAEKAEAGVRDLQAALAQIARGSSAR